MDISDNFTRFPGMTVKEHALKTIQDLPDDIGWEDVKERIEFLSAVEKGLKELDSGQGIPLEDIEKEIKAGKDELTTMLCPEGSARHSG